MAADHEHDEEDDRESVDALYRNWEHLVFRLRRTGDEVRALHARMTPWHGSERGARSTGDGS
ncbi:hypothetical protein AB0C88_33005 [Streptomyces chartreusis]|uniref:hypothetical protein n=1 Tax=Streptomyces chartreusis TaxID=1969 RepID=UPI0033C94B2D